MWACYVRGSISTGRWQRPLLRGNYQRSWQCASVERVTGKFPPRTVPPGQFPPDSSPPENTPMRTVSPGISLPDNSLLEKNPTRALPPRQFPQDRYNTDSNFKLLIKFFVLLRFPQTLMQFPRRNIFTVIMYFAYTYIDILRGRGDRQRKHVTLLSISIWNGRYRAENELPKSNNAPEGFHKTLRSPIASTIQINGDHPRHWNGILNFYPWKNTQLLCGDNSNKKKALSKCEL